MVLLLRSFGTKLLMRMIGSIMRANWPNLLRDKVISELCSVVRFFCLALVRVAISPGSTVETRPFSFFHMKAYVCVCLRVEALMCPHWPPGKMRQQVSDRS